MIATLLNIRFFIVRLVTAIRTKYNGSDKGKNISEHCNNDNSKCDWRFCESGMPQVVAALGLGFSKRFQNLTSPTKLGRV